MGRRVNNEGGGVLLDPQEAAKELGITYRQLNRLIEKKSIRKVTISDSKKSWIPLESIKIYKEIKKPSFQLVVRMMELSKKVDYIMEATGLQNQYDQFQQLLKENHPDLD